ncbi:hypothetical protein ACFLVN_05615 [Chloroflexota bacterium]
MTNFFRKLSREKLYKQWVEREGLSSEDLPADLKKDERGSIEHNNNSVYEVSPGRKFRPKIGQQIESIFTSTGIRFLFIMAIIIVVLLVALSVLLTILIMRGC